MKKLISAFCLVLLMNCSENVPTKNKNESNVKIDSIKTYFQDPDVLALGKANPDSVKEYEKFNKEPLAKKSIAEATEALNAKGVVGLIMGGKYATGVLISPHAILTTAKAIDDAGGTFENVYIQYWDPDSARGNVRILGDHDMHLFKHHLHDENQLSNNSLGLIVSDTPFPGIYGDDLLELQVGSPVGSNFEMYGVGTVSSKGSLYYGPHKGDEYINYVVSDGLRATENGNAKMCKADQGGPWVVDGYVVGISYGYSENGDDKCTQEGWYMYAVRINNEKIDWINSKLDLFGMPRCEDSQFSSGIVCNNHASRAGIVTNSHYSSSYVGRMVVDKDVNTKWNTADNVVGPHWIDFNFGRDVVIRSIVIKHASASDHYAEGVGYNTFYWDYDDNDGNWIGMYHNQYQNEISHTFYPFNGDMTGTNLPITTSGLKIWIHHPGSFYARIPEIEIN